jgi:hypothetical protein
MEDEDAVTLEYLVVPVKRGVAKGASEKLHGSALAVIEVVQDSANAVAPLEEALIRKFGRPSQETKYLVVPLDEGGIMTVRPTVDVEHSVFDSYRSL